MRGCFLAACLAAVSLLAASFFVAPTARAASEPKMLTGEEIKALFTGNTVAGTYTHGGLFSEYHAADGRAIGDNGYTLNVDACWNTDGDKVCYHYGPYKDRRTYCFTVEKAGESLILRVAGSGKLNAIGMVETGNPRSHGDGGRRWSCDDLLSRVPAQRDPHRPQQARAALQRALDRLQPGAGSPNLHRPEMNTFRSGGIYEAGLKVGQTKEP
jgi:hypothetical protein